MHHFISDLIYNMDHMHISGTKPSSVILSQTKKFKKLKSDSQNVKRKKLKQQRVGVINPQNYNFNQILTQKILNMKYCYFWFHSEVKLLTRFRHLFGLRVILPYFNAISADFYAVKCLIYIYFVSFLCL